MSLALCAFLAPPSFAASILFDHTKNETAGNADWVIDAQEPFPEPSQSGITPSTAGTFWTGAISSWGIALAKLGHTVVTLASVDSITYGQAANPRDLSRFKVYVVCEPQKPFGAGEKKALFDFLHRARAVECTEIFSAPQRKIPGSGIRLDGAAVGQAKSTVRRFF